MDAPCPAMPSNARRAILLAVATDTGVAVPGARMPVESTSAATYGIGAIQRYAALWAAPFGVTSVTRPVVAAAGTVVSSAVGVAAVTGVNAAFSRRLSFIGCVSKLVPLTVSAVPAAPVAGLKPLIVGALLTATTNAFRVAEPPGVVTPTV